MKVAQLIEELQKLPEDAVVLMDSDGGLSLVSAVDFVAASGPAAPAEVILLSSHEE